MCSNSAAIRRSRNEDASPRAPAVTGSTAPAAGTKAFPDTRKLSGTTQGFGTPHARNIASPGPSLSPSADDAPGLPFFRIPPPRRACPKEPPPASILRSTFPRSRSLSRRASLISICPNCCFHRWNLISEMFISWHPSTIDFPLSVSRKMRSSLPSRIVCLSWSGVSSCSPGGHLPGSKARLPHEHQPSFSLDTSPLIAQTAFL